MRSFHSLKKKKIIWNLKVRPLYQKVPLRPKGDTLKFQMNIFFCSEWEFCSNWEFFFGTPFFSEYYKKRTFLIILSYYISKRGAFFIKFIFRNSHLFGFLEFENFFLGHLFSQNFIKNAPFWKCSVTTSQKEVRFL